MPAFIVDKKHVLKDDDITESTLVNLGHLFKEENRKDSDSSRFSEKNHKNIYMKDSDSSHFTENTDKNINRKDSDSSLIIGSSNQQIYKDSDSSNSVNGHRDGDEAELTQCEENIVIDE